MSKYVILPGCSDMNRGDQALAWQTKIIAEQAGFKGDFYQLSEKNEPTDQSESFCLKIIHPILEHPSRKFKGLSNIHYGASVKIRWGTVALWDLCFSGLCLNNVTGPLFRHFLNADKKHTLEVLKQSDAVFMKGGGLLQTYGGFTATYSMYYWLYHLMLAQKLKKKVYILPNSFGPFEGPFVKKIAKNVLEKCEIVTARESLSQKMVQEYLGLQIPLYADLAFNLNASDVSKKDIFSRFNIPEACKCVAMTVRPYRFPHSDDPIKAYETFRREMADFSEWLYTQGFMPVYVVHTRAINEHENDKACIEQVTQMCNKEHYRIIEDDNFNCSDLKKIYSFFDYIVGTRFHSMIFAMSMGVPGIAISYVGNKSKGIMHDMNLDDYTVEIADVTAKVLEEKFYDLMEKRENVLERIKAYQFKAAEDYDVLADKMKR